MLNGAKRMAMFTEERAALRVGTFVVGALLLLIAGITIARGLHLGATFHRLYVLFPQTPGIEVGDPVTVNGVKRGMVHGYQNVPKGVVVAIAVDRLDDIRIDAVPRLLMLEVTGGRKIEISPGSAAASVQEGDTLYGQSPADIAEIIAQAAEFFQSSEQLLQKVHRVVDRMDSTVLSEQMIANIRNIIQRTERVTERLDSLVTENRETITNLLQNTNTLIADVQRFWKKNESIFDSTLQSAADGSKQLEFLLHQAEHTLHRLDTVLQNSRSILEKFHSNETVVGRFINDPKLNAQLDSTLSVLISLLTQIQQHGVNVNVRLGTRP